MAKSAAVPVSSRLEAAAPAANDLYPYPGGNCPLTEKDWNATKAYFGKVPPAFVEKYRHFKLFSDALGSPALGMAAVLCGYLPAIDKAALNPPEPLNSVDNALDQ